MTKGASGGKSVETITVVDRKGLKQSVSAWLSSTRPADYIGIQAYLNPATETTALLRSLQRSLRDTTYLATTLGFGPRFLHSTGQLHKGGPNSGLFLQLVDEPSHDIAVPDSAYTFGELIRAQALGDYQALKQRGRRVLRVNLGRDAASALPVLGDVIRD